MLLIVFQMTDVKGKNITSGISEVLINLKHVQLKVLKGLFFFFLLWNSKRIN